VNDEFAARKVVTEVIGHLERRRIDIAHDERAVRLEVERSLEPLRAAYCETGLPIPYFAALERELRATLPRRWQLAARPFTALETRGFSWRRGDVVARIVYVFLGLVVGGLCLRAPFIPIWEKWFPFALAVAGWWLPEAQAAWHRRHYARGLGAIVRDFDARQPALEGAVPLVDLMGPVSPPPSSDGGPPR